MKTTKLILALILTTPCAFSAPSATDQTEDETDKLIVALQSQGNAPADAAAVQQPLDSSLTRTQVEHLRKLAQNQPRRVAGTSSLAHKRLQGAGLASTPELPLVVATSPLETATLAQLREDLAVLAKLVDDAIADDREDHSVRRAMGIVVDWYPELTASANLYVEGCGAIVQAYVRFPLAPPTQGQTATPDEKPKNSAWESARRELFGGTNDDNTEFVFPPETREEYSAARVEDLKKNILKALANATSFRGLKSDESVTVAVRRPTSASKLVLFSSRMAVKPAMTSEEAKTTMTISIKKSDADALAAGAISEEEFGKRARVATY